VATTPLPIYTNAASATVPANLAYTGKSYLTFADLMQLPGFAGGGATAQAAINNLVNWRQAGSIASVGSTGPNFLQIVFNYAQNGFSLFQPGDSPFVSRQDLINYFASIDPKINTSAATYSQALPYLGTFSRAVSAPSWTPTQESNQDPNYQAALIPTAKQKGWNQNTGPILYKTNAETTGSPNRDLANVRYTFNASQNPWIITHYTDNGGLATQPTYNVNSGDPLLQGRFSLARIGWLKDQSLGGTDPNGVNPANGNNDPSANYATAIHACFGLVWGPPGTGYTATALTISPQANSTANGGNSCWNYVGSPAGPSGTLAKFNGTIETLDQVALEGREPNFFELLKAAILNGTLGLSPGLAAYNNGQDYSSPTNPAAPYGDGNHDFRPNAFPGTYTDLVGSEGLFSGTLGSAGPPAPATMPDMQIMQIGANIIDQYGADNFPTAIYFPYLSSPTLPGGAKPAFDPVAGYTGDASQIANALFGPVTMVYGIKNLPLLTKALEIVCTPNPVGALGTNGLPSSTNDGTTTMEGWIQPELWNPHQQPAVASNTTTPVHYEIRAYGSTYLYSREDSAANYAGVAQKNSDGTANVWNLSTPETYYPGLTSSEDPATSATFCGPQAGTLAFTVDNTQFPFSNPRLLTTDNLPGVTVDSTQGLPLSTTNPTSYAGPGYPYYGTKHAPGAFQSSPTSYYNHFAAFSAGVDNSWYVEGGPIDPSTHLPAPSAPAGGYTGIDFPFAASPYPTTGVSFALGWYTGNKPTATNFHPYSFISGCFLEAPNVLSNGGPAPSGSGPFYAYQYPSPQVIGDVTPINGIMNVLAWGLADPRTSRMTTYNENASETYNADDYPDTGGNYAISQKAIPGYNPIAPTISAINFVSPTFSQNSISDGFPQDWVTNNNTTNPPPRCGDWRAGLSYPYGKATTTYYADPDGVVRPGDGLYINLSSFDGNMLFLNNGNPTANGRPISATDAGNTQHGRRPVFLNRPYRSVGELGYVSRDLPFKTLDFFSSSSADAALLDVFSLTDETKTSSSQINSVVAGQFNPSNAPVPVIQAVLSGGSKKDIDSTYNIGTEVTTIARNCASALNPVGLNPSPLLNRSALVTQLTPAVIKADIAASSSFNSGDLGNKAYLEAPVRALANVTNTRTWNLMIDIIAQSGQMSPNANSLNDFIVQGERRYWLHVAIDRYTGKIVDQQLESVYE
jgi:hypothetical protein